MNIFIKNLPILILSVLSAVCSALSESSVFEKGRDIRPQLEQNEILRNEALRGELRQRELREQAYQAMRLDEPGEECVARDPAAKACLVTVEDFNKTLEAWDFAGRDQKPGFPTFEDAKRERATLLKSLLDEKYFEFYAADRQSQDSLYRLFDSARSEKVHAFRTHQGDSAYRALYTRHFARLFQGKEIRHYQALATSDSVLADSLRREIEVLNKAAKGTKHNPASLPWRSLAEEDLPSDLSALASALRPGEISAPIKRPYGFVFLRLHSARRTADQGFEEAMPVLISLKQAPSGQDKRLEAAVAAYYSRNAADFVAADTVQYRAWLLPDVKRKAGVRKADQLHMDTANGSTVTVMSDSLPQVIRDALDFYRPVQPGELLGPLHSLFGVWYFQPLSIRPSERPLTLTEAAPRIRQLLFGKTALSPETFAQQEAESKDKDLWKSLVRDYLRHKTGEGLSSAEAQQRMAKDKENWMRNRLQIRLVEWAGITLADPVQPPEARAE